LSTVGVKHVNDYTLIEFDRKFSIRRALLVTRTYACLFATFYTALAYICWMYIKQTTWKWKLQYIVFVTFSSCCVSYTQGTKQSHR